MYSGIAMAKQSKLEHAFFLTKLSALVTWRQIQDLINNAKYGFDAKIRSHKEKEEIVNTITVSESDCCIWYTVFLGGCANQLQPGGGKIDKEPPQIVEIYPRTAQQILMTIISK
jgi:hypothetical protein